MSNFKSNNREKKSYDQLEKTILKNGFNISIFNNDINLYLSKSYHILVVSVFFLAPLIFLMFFKIFPTFFTSLSG